MSSSFSFSPVSDYSRPDSRLPLFSSLQCTSCHSFLTLGQFLTLSQTPVFVLREILRKCQSYRTVETHGVSMGFSADLLSRYPSQLYSSCHNIGCFGAIHRFHSKILISTKKTQPLRLKLLPHLLTCFREETRQFSALRVRNSI